MLSDFRLRLASRLRAPRSATSAGAVIWSYRLFLDRDPEGAAVVAGRMREALGTAGLRRLFLESSEYRSGTGITSYDVSMTGLESAMDIEDVEDLEALFSHIQNTWQQFGESEPYWSVLVYEDYGMDRIAETSEAFYATGGENLAVLNATLERNGIAPSDLKTCLEYGCGVGRVTHWLAGQCDHVHGVDISAAHLGIASGFMEENGVDNVSFIHLTGPQDLASLPRVDLIYSVIVLQHNPPPIMKETFRQLLKALNPGGVAFIQMPTYRAGYSFGIDSYMSDDATRSEMEMHVLSQKDVFKVIQEEQAVPVEVLEDRWTGLRDGERSNTFVVQKA